MYFVVCIGDIKIWPDVLTQLCATLCNSTSRETGQTATTWIFGSRTRKPLDVAVDSIVKLGNDQNSRNSIRASSVPVYLVAPTATAKYKLALVEAIDVIKFAAVYMKQQCDAKHEAFFYNFGDFVTLRLHRGYIVPGLKDTNVKIEQQFAGLFRVLERVGRLAYRIEILPAMKMYPVISMAYLEPAPNPMDDPYRRPFSQAIIENLELVPEKLLRKRTQRRQGGG